MQLVIGQKTNVQAADELIAALSEIDPEDSILYIGYPILATADDVVELDALLSSRDYGVILFDFVGAEFHSRDLEDLIDEQNRLYLAVQSQLMKHESLCRRRELAIHIEVVSFFPSGATLPESPNLIAANKSNLRQVLEHAGKPLEEAYHRALNAALQRVTTIKPAKKRLSVKRDDSKGAILKIIEREVANLDEWQLGAAIESPEGPQRIRGLAGSGKTVVLALKAAYLHTANPNWKIVLTYNTRALFGQFQDLVRRFTFEHANDEPDLQKLRIIPAWGSESAPGVYSEIARYYGVEPKEYAYAVRVYGQKNAFKGVCEELLQVVREKPREPIWDAVLIDEAQDLPDAFFQLVYETTRHPKRIVWAYDELQNLGDYTMKPPEELFGKTEDGVPRVQLQNRARQPRQDIILPVCYRNTPWGLTVAHALGFGVYRDRPVQSFDDPEYWRDIGYEVVSGVLEPGESVVLRRGAASSPGFFARLFDNPEETIKCMVFDDDSSQWDWIAESIIHNINHDELEPSDILVILCDPVTARTRSGPLMAKLNEAGIKSHLAGVTTTRERLFIEDSVAITGIYRAKGNEAAMVYVADAHYCYEGLELIKKRNILFTAITRSHAWVNICGVGEAMESLKNEYEKVLENDFQLRFRLPTKAELEQMRQIHRDLTPEEREAAQTSIHQLQALVEALEGGVISPEVLPPQIRQRLLRLLQLDDGVDH